MESAMSVQDRILVHPDIKPENPPERAAHFLDVPKIFQRARRAIKRLLISPA
jgi:hypothetical protein